MCYSLTQSTHTLRVHETRKNPPDQIFDPKSAVASAFAATCVYYIIIYYNII